MTATTSTRRRPTPPSVALFAPPPPKRFRATPEAPAIRRVGIKSVLRMSLAVFTAGAVVLVSASAAVWTVARTTGITGNIESLIADLFALRSFRFRGDVMWRIAIAGAAVLVAVGTAISFAAAVLFNVAAKWLGGLDITLADETADRRRRGPRGVRD